MSQPLVSIDEARAIVLRISAGRLGEEQVPVEEALDRVLAVEVRASADIPRFPASAMDGYAVAGGDSIDEFSVVGESRAGTPYADRLAAGEAVRISTGGAVPNGATAVVRQEDVALSDGRVRCPDPVEPGTNIRPAGDDMRAGELVLPSGTRLGPGELGAAVAAGADELTVAQRPRVALVCTGDELKAPGESLGPGEIHNSNGPMLRALAHHCGAQATPAQTLRDEPEATQAALRDALAGCDVLIISGGVSVGPHDHVKPALERLGVQQHFWGVALQPGKPTWFGSRDRRLVFGLPGNPVSAAVTFSLFVRLALESLLGARPRRQIPARAVLGMPVKRNPTRDQAIRVRLDVPDGAAPVASPTGAQDSHLLTSLVRGDALAIIPRGEGQLEIGSMVVLEPLPR